MRILQEEVALSVVVCHHKGRELLKRCLDSVYNSKGVTFEVILVTSDSSLHHDTWLKEYPALRVIFAEGGPAYKRNFGVQFAKGKYYAFLDDDVELSLNCLYHMWMFMEMTPKCGMQFTKILNMERRNEFDDCGSWLTRTGFLYARSGNHQKDRGQYDQPERCASSKSATCLARPEAFRESGGFDSAYYILGEETDLSYRMWLRGWETWYNPRAVSWHAFGTSLKPRPDYYTIERVHFHGCKNYINFLCTNLSLKQLIPTLPIHLAIWVASSVGFLCIGEWRRSWQIWRGIGWNLANWQKTSAKRRLVQSTRVVTDKELLPLVMRNVPLSYYLNRFWRYLGTQLHG